MTGAVIGALAGAAAVLLFRFSQRKKGGAEDTGNTAEKPSGNVGQKAPAKIEYRK